jgi:predicted phage-related endonuclease
MTDCGTPDTESTFPVAASTFLPDPPVVIPKMFILLIHYRPINKMRQSCGETEVAYLYDYTQGSEEWQEARKGGVGGTTVGELVVASKYKTKEQAIAGCVCPSVFHYNRTTLRGSLGEKYVRAIIAKEYGLTIREIGLAVRKDYPFMRASPDGIYTLPDGSLGLLEIKVVSSKYRLAECEFAIKQLENMENATCEIPINYWHQTQYTALILGAKEITFCTLLWAQAGEETRILVWRYDVKESLFNEVYLPAAKLAFEEINKIKCAPRQS